MDKALTTSPDGRWFTEAKYAMFVHWGPYAVAAGAYKGKRYPGIGEWIMLRAQIPVKEYEKIARRFNPVKFNARQWATIARDAGMKYIVLTAKHHDGFGMFRSKASRYNIVDFTPFKRDPMEELADACGKAGLKLGFYYSQFQDWHEPGGAGNGWDNPKPAPFAEYFQGKCLPQVRELLSNYGPMALIWFDTPGSMSREDSLALVKATRELQPDCLINSRIGNGVGDYDSLGDQEVPLEGHEGLWETVDTHNDTWGYVEYDHNWKSPRELVERLVRVVGKGGNYMLNVGPTGLGEIPPASAAILRKAGAWIARNRQAIYSTTPSPLGRVPWGECTAAPGKCFLNVFDWPAGGKLQVPGLKGKVKKAYLLSQPAVKLKASAGKGALTLSVPRLAPDPLATVVVLEAAGKLSTQPGLVVLNGHRNDLDPPFALVRNCQATKGSWMEKFGDWKHAHFVTGWKDSKSTATWSFRALAPGRFYIDLEYSALVCSDGTEGEIVVDAHRRPVPILDTGERIEGSPMHGCWPFFRTYHAGILDLAAGSHTLSFRPLQPVENGWIKLKSISLVPVPGDQ